jgi:protein TonB
MRRGGAFAVAAGLAAGLHLAAFAALGSGVPSGAESAGGGGEALVSLVASDASIAAMVAAWQRPPEVAVPDTAVQAAPVMEAAPVLPQPEEAGASVAMPDLPKLPTAEAAPDFAAIAPPPRPVPKPKPEPAPVAEAPKPAEPAKPAPDSVAQPAQAAAGKGGKGAAGAEGTAQAATAAGAAEADLRAEWGADIRARIERRKSYPRDGDGAEGTVKLRIVVGADGRLRGVGIATSSGSEALDRAAVRAVERAGRFARAPDGIEGEVSFTLPVSFRP